MRTERNLIMSLDNQPSETCTTSTDVLDNHNPDIAISVRNLSKKYQLYDSPQHRLKEALNPFRKKYHRDFWVLKDINLEIPRGSTFGIVGQNGSGKSTLLQVICGILQPTQGEVMANGRISALLELGSGFNKAFTGRENVFMQGAIMGIERKEMEERFDRIADFADIGYFIDQPVKTYSSGMYVRLAFACAINVDPEILIVDEALAVGDAMFQRRCYRRLDEFQKSGKTILFVSHNLATVMSICTTAAFLDKGKIIQTGKPKDVVNVYSKVLAEREEEYARRVRGEKKEAAPRETDERLSTPEELHFGSGGAEILDCMILTRQGEETTVLQKGERYIFRTTVHFNKDVQEPSFGINITTPTGLEIYSPSTSAAKLNVEPIEENTTVVAEFEMMIDLNIGDYFVNVNIAEFLPSTRVFLDRHLDVLKFKVISDTTINGLIDSRAKMRIRKAGV